MSEQAFHHAAAIADIEAIRSLIESGANAAEVNKYNETPLHALTEAYHKKIYDYQRIYDTTIALLEAKVSALRKEENGNLCYHWAAAQTDVRDINGNTPLMYAAANRKQSLARNYIELMSQFGNLKPDAVNNDGKTALDIATENGSEEVVKYLLTSFL